MAQIYSANVVVNPGVLALEPGPLVTVQESPHVVITVIVPKSDHLAGSC